MERILCIILTTVVAIGRPYPQGVDPNRIYTPDDLNELRAAIAYDECLKTPGCDPNRQPNAKCQVGSGAESMVKDMVDLRTTRACVPMTGMVLWPATGQCVELLTQGPCPPGQWVKLSNPGYEPVCARQPCHESEALMAGRECHSLQDRSACPDTKQLFTNEFGEAECDCKPGLIYHKATDTCYTPYTQGPCHPGQIIKVLDSGQTGRGMCVENPCSAPGMVRLDSQCQVYSRAGVGTTCHQLNTEEPCQNGFLTIDESLGEPLCLQTQSIFNIPNTKRCNRGSMRDGLGRCRRNLALQLQEFPPIVTSRPRPHPGGRLCPPGQTLLAGTCLKLSL